MSLLDWMGSPNHISKQFMIDPEQLKNCRPFSDFFSSTSSMYLRSSLPISSPVSRLCLLTIGCWFSLEIMRFCGIPITRYGWPNSASVNGSIRHSTESRSVSVEWRINWFRKHNYISIQNFLFQLRECRTDHHGKLLKSRELWSKGKSIWPRAKSINIFRLRHFFAETTTIDPGEIALQLGAILSLNWAFGLPPVGDQSLILFWEKVGMSSGMVSRASVFWHVWRGVMGLFVAFRNGIFCIGPYLDCDRLPGCRAQ
jgi:hypothetical protein